MKKKRMAVEANNPDKREGGKSRTYNRSTQILSFN